jgi:hypothetical protein
LLRSLYLSLSNLRVSLVGLHLRSLWPRSPSSAPFSRESDSGGIFPVDIFLVGMWSRYVRETLRSNRPRCSYRFRGPVEALCREFEIASHRFTEFRSELERVPIESESLVNFTNFG